MRPFFVVVPTILVCSLLAFAILATEAGAQEDGDPVSIGTWHVLESEVLGETRRLAIHLPRGYEGSGISYPVVYHTYGDYLPSYFVPASATIENLGSHAFMPQMILVGIDNIDRYRDLRPIQRNGQPGGIAAYTEFLTNEVLPWVEANYRTADYRILIGPQAGAVFGLFTLLENPDLFDAFILDNPFTHEPSTQLMMAKAEEIFTPESTLSKFCFVTFGSGSANAAADVYGFAALAEGANNDDFRLHLNHLHDDVDYLHPRALETGLKLLFPDYHRTDKEVFAGLRELEDFYGKLSERYGFTVAPPELIMTYSAGALQRCGQVESARSILERQIQLYPNMVNGFWQLAGIAADGGRTNEAIRYYQRCIEIDSSMANFANRRIAELQGQ
jgi:predicted alpha/beta superfamily hydrolase